MYKNIVFIDKEYINKKMEDLEKELSILNNQLFTQEFFAGRKKC